MLLKRNSVHHQAVEVLQGGLAFLGYHPGSVDGFFGEKTEEAVEAWQHKAGLYPDGLFGRGSVKAWNTQFQTLRSDTQFLFVLEEEQERLIDTQGPRLPWVSLTATPMPNGHGFKSLLMRSDAADAYLKLQQYVTRNGGYMTTAGGKRGLTSKSSASRSKKSFHYTGRAFDLATYSALGNPLTDPFLCVREEGSRSWTVWCHSKDPHVPVVTLNVTTCLHKKTSSGKRYTQLEVAKWTGRAFNFTAKAKELGFESIRGRSSFFRGGNYMGAEWWHFQWTTGLVKGQSTFGEELLRVYTWDQCQDFIYWKQSKDAVYGVSWF